MILPCVGDEFLGLFRVRNFVLEPFFLELHRTEAGEEGSKGVEKLRMGKGVARDGPNDKLLDIWEVAKELDDAGIKFINIGNGLLIHSRLYYEPADVCA